MMQKGRYTLLPDDATQLPREALMKESWLVATYIMMSTSCAWFLLFSEFIFPDFPGENELFSSTNLIT